jgi:Uma2 family endonuclease
MASLPKSSPLRFRDLNEYFTYLDTTDEHVLYNRGEGLEPEAATPNHPAICSNLNRVLGNKLYERPNNNCRVFHSSMLVWTPLNEQPYFPDVTVTGGELQFYGNRSDVITNPQVIFEVLSKRTEGLDKGEKLDGYFSILGFREYILIDQQRPLVSHYTRVNGDIVRHDLLLLDDSLHFKTIPVELPLAEIYRGIHA